MTKTIKIDKAGRLVLPKPFRRRLHLRAGDRLEITETGDALTLRPSHPTVSLQKERDIWVYRSGQSPTESDLLGLIDNIRDERSRSMRE